MKSIKLITITAIGILICSLMISACDRKEARGPISNKGIETAVTKKLSENLGSRFFRFDGVEYDPEYDAYQITVTGLTDKGRKKTIVHICQMRGDDKGYRFDFDYKLYDPRVTDDKTKFTMILDESLGDQTQVIEITPTDGDSTDGTKIDGLAE